MYFVRQNTYTLTTNIQKKTKKTKGEKMNYYGEKKKANAILEERIKKCSDLGGAEINILVYELTKDFEIGENTIKKRIELLKKVGKVREEVGVLTWLKKEKSLKKE